MSNEREQLIARLRRFAVVLEARGETYDAETCEQAIASLSAPVAEPPLYTIGRGSDGRATVTTTPAPDLIALVNQQAEDEGLWFVAQTAPEAYLQAALRKLHAAIEVEQEE